jgi:hypothetical protein
VTASQESGEQIMPTTFQEFLRRKAETSDWKDRSRRRGEWLDAVHHLFDRIQNDLRDADREGLLEVVPYEVERVEDRLGVYDAPALKIRLGTDAVDILPVGRYATGPFALQNLQLIPGNAGRWGDLSGGRVDVTNGERRHVLLRSVEDGQDRWYAHGGHQVAPTPFDKDTLEAIFLDLMK